MCVDLGVLVLSTSKIKPHAVAQNLEKQGRDDPYSQVAPESSHESPTQALKSEQLDVAHTIAQELKAKSQGTRISLPLSPTTKLKARNAVPPSQVYCLSRCIQARIHTASAKYPARSPLPPSGQTWSSAPWSNIAPNSFFVMIHCFVLCASR